MPPQIALAPVGAGKTAYALARVAETLTSQPFARVWVLVSGRRQEDAFRQRLVEQPGSRKVYFNLEFFSFYQLYHRLLNIAQQPPRRLEQAARYGLLRSILADLRAQGKLPVFGEIAGTPGFLRIVAEFIYELKQNLVTPETFAGAVQTAKDDEVALIYARYQQALQDHALVDREGEGWLALAVLRRPDQQQVARDVDLLVVDGYDQFTPLQATLLMLVASRAHQALITLATVPGRADTVGGRFAEALDQLQRSSPVSPQITDLPANLAAQRPPELQHVVDQIFLRGAVARPAGDRVAFIEAPDAGQEAAAVLRRVKRLLLDGQTRPDDILIALRDWPGYAGHFAALGRAYGLPLALHRGDALNQNPAVMMLLNLLALHETDFRRRDLLDVLRSPYFAVPGLDRAQVKLLERISQQMVVVSGRQTWLDAITRAGQPVMVGEDEDSTHEALLDADSAAQLRRALEAFFHAITPPPNATLGAYVGWLYDLIGHDSSDPEDGPEADESVYSLDMPAQIRQGDVPGVADRDLTALDELMHVMRGLLSAEALLHVLDASRSMSRALFLLELRTAVDGATLNRGPVRSGRVLVTTVTDARGLPHRYVFIPGLSEGIFPVALAEDPLYLDSERVRLRERGLTLETQAERAADDGLFYQLIGLARDSLTLSRPTVRDGTRWVASHLWRAATAVVSEAEDLIRAQEVKVGAVAGVESAACGDELLLALADGFNAAQTPDNLMRAYAWALKHYGAQWGRITHARTIELRRLARGEPHDPYSGRLRDPVMIDYVAGKLGPDRVWSASQLNDYGMCGFRFFARRLLKLEALEEPEEGLDAPRLGTINHAILERTYAEIGRRGLLIAPDNLDEALAVLRAAAVPVLDTAPEEHGFPANALWEQEKVVLLRRLEALVRVDFSESNPVSKAFGAGERVPFAQEAPFTPEGDAAVRIPIEIEGHPEALRVQGFIDRMDQIGSGVILIDYKSGSTPIPVADMQEGRNFQMMIYLNAAAQLLASRGADGPQVMGGLFWHIRSRKSSGDIRLDNEGLDALSQARGHIGRYIAAGRRGDFSVRPRKLDRGRCAHYCEFAQLCRVAGTNRFKPEDDSWT